METRDRMPTAAAEEIYSILERYAEVSSKYYDREGFIYNFGVVPNPLKKFHLKCFDGKRRTFIKDGTNYRMEGPGDAKVNSLVKQILAKHSGEKIIETFNVTKETI